MKFFKRAVCELVLAAGLVASTSLATARWRRRPSRSARRSTSPARSPRSTPALNGVKLKAKEINDAGGINGKQIELVIYDTKTDPTVIASTASQPSTRTGAGGARLHRFRLRCWRSGRSSSRPACPS